MAQRLRAAEEYNDWTEGLTRDWLKRKGEFVLPVSLIERGGAPLIEAMGGSLIAPDILTMRDGSRAWWEVKRKASATFTRATNLWETGIDWANFESYASVSTATGIPVRILFLHEREDEVLVQDIDALPRPRFIAEASARKAGWETKGGMAMWPCHAFERVCSFKDMQRENPGWSPRHRQKRTVTETERLAANREAGIDTRKWPCTCKWLGKACNCA